MPFGDVGGVDFAGTFVLRHLDFARIMAGKLYARRATDEIGFDEYLQLASLGLLEAEN